MKLNKNIALAAILAFSAPAAFADTDKAELEKLRTLVQELDQKIRALESKLERKSEAPVAAPARTGGSTNTAANVSATSDITVYGRVNMNFESARNDRVSVATTAKSVSRIQSNASRFGLKGSEALGDNLSAIWQLEAQFDVTGNTTSGINGTRNSNVGLKGNFGTVFVGNWDTPYKLAHNKLELFDNASAFTATSLVGRTGHTNTTAFPAAPGAHNVNYNTRQTSVFQYWSPVMNGFQGMAAYSPDSASTTTADRARLSLSGTYENDMLYGALAYENRPDQSWAGVNDSAARLVGAYKFGGGLIGLMYEQLSVGTAAATTESQRNWELAGNYKFGNNNIGAFYARNGNLGARVNTGADMYSLRYGYNFSKRTELYGAYTRLSNDASANYSTLGTTAGTVGAVAAGTLGSTQSGLGLGVIYNF